MPFDFHYQNSEILNPVMSISEEPETKIVFNAGPAEMLKVTENGFYVRGKKVPVDDNEAAAVYKAFTEFLVYHALTRSY